MLLYFIPFSFIYILSIFENLKIFNSLLSNKYFYILLSVFFIFFVGLRIDIGCDWNGYLNLYEKYSALSWGAIIKNNFTSINNLEDFGHLLITKISNNIYTLNLLYSIIFVVPLFFFCSTLKRKYFSLLISYPYYVIVVGMGPIRQAACISILMFSIILIARRGFYLHFILTIISLLIHQSSIIINTLILIPSSTNLIKNKLKNRYILIILLIFIITIFSLPSIINTTSYYFKFYGNIVPQAKGAIYIWFIHLIPTLIFLNNVSRFNFEKALVKILILFCVLEFLLLPLIFFNSVIAYRLLLYLFPSSILITSYIPDLKLFGIKSSHFQNIINGSSFLSLIIWLNFAFHASCWIPYKNLLLG